jgi:hypothetical protein
MKITPLARTGGSAKYTVGTKRGDFMVSLSRTLCDKWRLTTEETQRDAAEQIALAIVGRHNPAVAFKDKYIFADHNTQETLAAMVAYLHKYEL